MDAGWGYLADVFSTAPIPARNDTKHNVGINVGINFIEHILSHIYQVIIAYVRIL